VAFIFKFVRDESGAVTVDWVVLTAAVVGLGIGVIAVLEPSLNSSATAISNAVTDHIATLVN